MSDLRRWRKRRWRQDPRCAYCGVVTILHWRPPKLRDVPRGDPRRRPPPNLATVEHLRDRYDPARREPARGDVRRVLACLGCNNALGAARTMARPQEELWRRAGHYERIATGRGARESTS